MSKSFKSASDNRASQINPVHPVYHRLRSAGDPDNATQMRRLGRGALDNRANQLNPNNVAYWASRGVLPEPSTSSNPSSAKPE